MDLQGDARVCLKIVPAIYMPHFVVCLVESIFKTHFSGRFKKDVKVLTVERCIRKYKYFHKANIVLCYNIIKMSEGMRIFKK